MNVLISKSQFFLYITIFKFRKCLSNVKIAFSLDNLLQAIMRIQENYSKDEKNDGYGRQDELR